MTTTNDIYTRYQVTAEQVNACHRIYKGDSHQCFYQVESSQNNGVEYIVQFNPIVKAITCTCKAGENGRGCWHRRAAQAHAEEFRTYQRAMLEAEAVVAEAEVASEIAEDRLNRVQAEKAEGKAVRADGLNAYNRKPFQFLR